MKPKYVSSNDIMVCDIMVCVTRPSTIFQTSGIIAVARLYALQAEVVPRVPPHYCVFIRHDTYSHVLCSCRERCTANVGHPQFKTLIECTGVYHVGAQRFPGAKDHF